MRQVTYSMQNQMAKPAAFVSTSGGAEYGPYQTVIIAVGGSLSNNEKGLLASIQDCEPHQIFYERDRRWRSGGLFLSLFLSLHLILFFLCLILFFSLGDGFF